MAAQTTTTEKQYKGIGWGGSLSVPSVQELVKTDPLSIPERYKKQVSEKSDAVDWEQSDLLPIIDLSLLANGDEQEKMKLESACESWGFFQVINHGVDAETLYRARAIAAEFFERPLEEKRKYAMKAGDVQGYGQVYVNSPEQRLDWNDMLFLLTGPEEQREYSFWPEGVVPGFKDALNRFSAGIAAISSALLANISTTLKMEPGALLELHRGARQAIRMGYCPPCSNPDEVIGHSPHSDLMSLTLVLQDDHVTALQIRRNGKWVPVKPIPNALVVNVGDSLESWSNGKYESIEHRVVANSTAARISIATFVVPADEAEIAPLDHLVTRKSPAKYKKVKFGDYIRYSSSKKLEGKIHCHSLKL